jgi:hypothetical protein
MPPEQQQQAMAKGKSAAQKAKNGSHCRNEYWRVSAWSRCRPVGVGQVSSQP